MRYAILVTIALLAGSLPLAAQSPAGAIEQEAERTSPSAEAFAQERDDDEPDITQMVILTLAAAGAAAVVSLIGYAIRQRLGFWLHRPPPRDGGAPEDHH